MTEQEYIKVRAKGTITAAINTLRDIIPENLTDVMSVEEYSLVMKMIYNWSDRLYCQIETDSDDAWHSFDNKLPTNIEGEQVKVFLGNPMWSNYFMGTYTHKSGSDMVDRLCEYNPNLGTIEEWYMVLPTHWMLMPQKPKKDVDFESARLLKETLDNMTQEECDTIMDNILDDDAVRACDDCTKPKCDASNCNDCRDTSI